jgi:hypothetical protein
MLYQGSGSFGGKFRDRAKFSKKIFTFFPDSVVQ